MCGFAAIFGGATIDEHILKAMSSELVHRGPDGAGHTTTPHAGFAHRRLAIVDVARGQQPMVVGERWTLVFNGEIYNHVELRRSLEAEGVCFETQSDTEVLLRGYIAWGAQVVERLRGMFAFAIWDEVSRTGLVVRDPMGVKPLYWTWARDQVLIASEIKALLAHPYVPRQPRLEAIDAFLGGLMFPGRMTAFEGINALPAGHRMRIRMGEHNEDVQTRVERYFRIPFPPERDATDDFVPEVLTEIRRTVDLRRMSDVPIGLFLSGGVDSGLVATQLAETHPDPIRSFSMIHAGDDADLSEAVHIDTIAARENFIHTSLPSDPAWADQIPDLIRAFDQPCTSALNSFCLSERAARDVKVVLTGTGGDETFAGYDRYLLGLEQSDVSLDERANAYLSRISVFKPADRQRLYDLPMRPYARDGFWERSVREHFTRADLHDPVSRCLHVDQSLYLIDNLHRNLDAVTMAHSLEARVPLCDIDFVSFANSIPSEAKMSGGESKALLRQVAATVLPRSVVYRRKQGFGIPVARWMSGPFGRWILSVLTEDAIRTRGLFRWDEVKRMIDRSNAGGGQAAQRLWMLMTIEVWFRMYIDERPSARVPSAAELVA